MRTLSVNILGTGEEMPRRVVDTAEVAALCGVPETEAVRRTGVRTRHWLSDTEDPLVQGAAAATKAIAQAGLTAGDIDVVLNASGTPMQAIPDGGSLLAAELGMTDCFAFSVHATCLSFLVAFQEAAFLIDAGRAERVLIVSTEAGSRGLNFDQPESSLLIGDAAAAVVVGRAETPGQGLVAAAFTTDPGGVHDAEIRGYGSRLAHGRGPARPEDYMFDMNGPRLLRGAADRVPAFLEGLRPGLSTGTPGIDKIVPHQASKAGIAFLARMWGLEKMTITLAEVGNTIAASIPLALHRTDIRSGETVLLVGSGAGTHYGGLIVQW